MKVIKLVSLGCCVAALASCAPPLQAVKVTHSDKFSPQFFRYFKASTLAVWNHQRPDRAALNDMSQQLYQHSYSYPTHAYFYFPSALRRTYGSKMLRQMEQDVAANNKFSPQTIADLSKHKAPFRFISWAKIHNNTTYRKEIDDDKNCDANGENCSASNSFNSYRKVTLQASIYDIQRQKITWQATITANRDNVYYSPLSGLLGSALSHMFDKKLPYPKYPSTKDALDFAFSAMGSKVYDGKSVLQFRKKRFKE